MKHWRLLLLLFLIMNNVLALYGQNNRPEENVMELIHKVNSYWQKNNSPQVRSFWDNAAYHTGNMEVYGLTGNADYLKYSIDWAEHNQWKGATSDNKAEWKQGYGETSQYVLFGDWQCCFQTYADLYGQQPEDYKIARAREVMEYEMGTGKNNYWWWADGLYMVMPVMTKLYKITGNPLYLEKLHEYFLYADSVMYDPEVGLYYRDGSFVYPKHTILGGKKDFWARGDGWVIAALSKILQDLPETDRYRQLYIDRYLAMAKALAGCQHPDGYWTRSLLEHDFAPGPETSGTAFFTYGLQWGINNGLLDGAVYQPVVDKAWKYLATVALQPDGRVGYVQPIGGSAIPDQVLDANSTANFGVGAFLLAACERYRYLQKDNQNNPALNGYYADPEVMYSRQTGKYYIYPTSDGFEGWSGYYFKAFSSDNLKDWKDEGVILDLKKDISWTDKNAWAPCCIERKVNGAYKYFYYFTGGQRIGVAVADTPTGPFKDALGKPLVDFRPAGVKGGQEIDPDVFQDPVSGKCYLYWGNGYMAGVELNDDMVSLDSSKVVVMTPQDGTFREAAYVFYRKGLYYFLWSEDDTRSENYRVRYATSTSPLGALNIPKDNLILWKRPEKGIYGTGHNSVLQVPGKDEWYIVYHRFHRPDAVKMGKAAGYHREVCMDKLEFNGDGSIKVIEPTL